MQDNAKPPHLLHFRVSHYNEKVRWTLDHKAWPHTRQAVIPGFHAARIRLLTGQQQVPVLRLDGRWMHGSDRILEAIERHRPDPPLFPADPGDRARAVELEDYYDNVVAPGLRRLFWSTYIDDPGACARMATDGCTALTRRAWQALFPLMRPLFRDNMGIHPHPLEEARAAMRGWFDRLEQDIGPGGYLVGDTFTIADLTAAAVMTAIIRPPEFPYPLPEPWPTALVELREQVAGHPAFEWVLEIYTRHRGESWAIRDL